LVAESYFQAVAEHRDAALALEALGIHPHIDGLAVNPLVNSPKNDLPECLAPVA
jgi:hypothetical protein